MIRIHFLFIFMMLALATAPFPLRAADPKAKLETIEDKLNAKKSEAEQLEDKAKEASEGLKDLREKLIHAAEDLQDKAAEEAVIATRLENLKKDIALKDGSLDDEKKKLTLLTNALIELSRQPPETMFLQKNLTSDHIHRTILIRDLLPRIKKRTESITRDLVAFNNMQVLMVDQKRLLAAAQQNLEWQQHNLDELIKTRQGLLQRTEEQKKAIAAQLALLSSEASDLRQLLDKVTPKSARRPQQLTLLSILKAPVAGKIIRAYGAKDADGVRNEGLTYAAPSGSPVVAPRAGRIVFQGPFKGYGEIMILQHNGGYHSFIAGFGRIDADMGQDVEAGEPLGVLPVKNDARPELYFEWRHNNEPVDPTGGITLSKSQ